ncbi:NAD(P)H-dependent oxidoreductase [Kocuria marina]|nr:NAD(P)H-dependent oxidoreductase [Kocuria marina]
MNQLKSQVESQEISFDILRPGDYQLAPVFDPSVFFTGNDPSDGTIGDDGTMIKQKLLDADFIIFSSPVYAHSVSSDFKRLIDRTASWMHIFRLLGKPSMSVVTASNNGFIQVQEYLEYYMGSLGMEIVESTIIRTSEIPDERYTTHVAGKIRDCLAPGHHPTIGDLAEVQFKYFQRHYRDLPDTLAEPRYWQEKGWFDVGSLQEYVDRTWGKM